MTFKTQKIISTALIAAVAIGGLQVLLVILNLNQIGSYLHVAFWIYAYLVVNAILLYDLHFKTRGSFAAAKSRYGELGTDLQILGHAFWDRIAHLRQWRHLRHWLNYLILPACLYWATVSIFYLFLGNLKVQQLFAALSGFALIFTYWHLKEIFTAAGEVRRHGTHVALSVIKLYTVFLVCTAAFGLTRRFCLDFTFLGLALFAMVFFLAYQALFQHALLNARSMLLTMVLAVIMALLGLVLFFHWGLNLFTAGAFLMVWYNFFWSLLHHRLENKLTWAAFSELLAVTIVVSVVLLGSTNFRARIDNQCGV